MNSNNRLGKAFLFHLTLNQTEVSCLSHFRLEVYENDLFLRIIGSKFPLEKILELDDALEKMDFDS